MIRYHGGGVAMMMIARAKGALMEWMPINKSIITARFYSKYKKLTVVKAYAPTNDAMDKENNELYNQLPDTESDCNGNDIMVVKGDLNAKVAKNNTNRGGCGKTGTNFPQKDIHKLTWGSPDGRTVTRFTMFSELKHENIYIRHQSNERSRRIQ